ncbi:MAG: hypothetical protein GWO04_00830, partial [Actinobacteria bacterium]|nr:hypothetical protein [Actinomycetota bacterium]NIS28579.1 hypothetical protein [Actinomycetota bacterium]NIW25845.1 hypothetical protein [Actinomycetota bacterium]
MAQAPGGDGFPCRAIPDNLGEDPAPDHEEKIMKDLKIPLSILLAAALVAAAAVAACSGGTEEASTSEEPS